MFKLHFQLNEIKNNKTKLKINANLRDNPLKDRETGTITTTGSFNEFLAKRFTRTPFRK